MPLEAYKDYKQQLLKIADLHAALAVLHWDNEVNAPKKGAEFRARQLSTLSALAHEAFCAPALGELLAQIEQNHLQDLDDLEKANIRLSREDFDKATKLPTAFVRELSEARSAAYQAWIAARRAKDFGLFKAALKRLVELKRQEAKYLGYAAHPYDALLNEYEKGMKVEILDPLFAKVREELVAFTKQLREQGKASDRSPLSRHYPKDQQWAHGLELLANMGYDFEAGRQDISEHPFTTTFSPLDVRVTARISEDEPMSMIGTCLHEGGHALYEQGLKPEQYGLPLGQAASLGVHESQSRLWENHVGLSYDYWVYQFPKMQAIYPEQLGHWTLDEFYRAINQVAPNLIRVEADELHYHLHVLIRYELEKGLMEGSLEVEHLDQVWNAKYAEFLGIEVPDDKAGILQDVHWCEGLFGYFPTYSLGSFYAAQFFAQAQKDLPQLAEQFRQGDSSALLAWLREHIHQHGRRFTSEELCQRITGQGLNLDFFLAYVRQKYSAVYGL